MRGFEKAGAEPYTNSMQHILAELDRIALLIHAQVWQARQIQVADEQFQGLVITEAEVDALLANTAGLPRWAMAPESLSATKVRAQRNEMAADISKRKAESQHRGVRLRLSELANLFKLSPFEVDILLACLAPELDLRYERLYAYLQDDVTKKRPSVDLILNLLCPSFESKLSARRHLSLEAPLRRYHLLEMFDDPSQPHPPLLGRYLKIDERIVGYLLETDESDTRLLPYAQYVEPQASMQDLLLAQETKDRLTSLVQTNNKQLVFYFRGSYGVGKQSTAEALCQELGIGLLVVDGKRLLHARNPAFEFAVSIIIREVQLKGAALYWTDFDALLADDARAERIVLMKALDNWLGITFLAGDTLWEPADAWHDLPFVSVSFPYPSYRQRVHLWTHALNDKTPCDADVDPEALANKFRFSGGQIQDAAATAYNLARWREPEIGHVRMDDLYTACRLQSNRKLATLAHKITPHFTWDDIVLPPDQLEQLREICNYVKYRAQVYDVWGFSRKLTLGKGLSVLFAGPSGTGKTMAAEILAHTLRLDLYKIDLSTVVSKYIGETEKNLARIFAEAETSNAILFFDEADALFGKRSEVRDAHDRYANIEISYLLQRMEEYEGVVILATNLQENMDDAFVRRLHFNVEFPFPTERYRRRIWEGMWPADTPRSPDLDLDFMARSFELTGGNIRNVALTAAFLAADDGQKVNMGHLIHATQREYQKMGKMMMDGEFGEYARYIQRKT